MNIFIRLLINFCFESVTVYNALVIYLLIKKEVGAPFKRSLFFAFP